LLNPLLPVAATFGFGFLFWYLFMPDTSMVVGVAPRHESSAGYFLFFLFFSSFFAGMLAANANPVPSRQTASLPNHTWLTIGWVALVITLVADYLYLRSGVGSLEGATSYVDAIHSFSGAVRENSSFGATSLNNLFPLPLVIGAGIAMGRRPTLFSERLQGTAMAGVILLLTLAHGATGFGRIWFLFSILTLFVVWILERRPRLRIQVMALTGAIVMGGAFIVIMELLRNVGLTAQAANLNFTDTRILRLAFLTLSQAYVASDVNNAMVVFDCHAAGFLVSTFDVIAKFLESGFGMHFPNYSGCPGWTSMFGTINFLALMWWDWGYIATIVLFAIGFGIQKVYVHAIAPSAGISFAEVLFPNVLFGAMHLTRTMFIGSTEFLLPSAALLVLYAVYALGASQSREPSAT
jgi:hypothetical protein